MGAGLRGRRDREGTVAGVSVVVVPIVCVYEPDGVLVGSGCGKGVKVLILV